MSELEDRLILAAVALVVAGIVITYAAWTLPQRIFRAP